ncbi:LysM peptidoglycan-binding domain-containing protein [Spirosoma rigui]|uniref:LysM peptidoglycan-binding domain-containing protein n=1 Tax=Spirosoma rigui TaxID=564064 RepID=UPI0014764B3D|nr:LysM peptidoglycan-binding domain-containing protein [Spirosoma rigui]
MNVLKVFAWVLFTGLVVLSTPRQLSAQSIPDVPFDIDFAGVTVHLNEQGREQLKREVALLYTNRPGIQRDIESLRQLTPLLEPLLTAERLPMDYRYATLPFTTDSQLGYWGLTRDQALILNMVVNEEIDERYNPILATETVAARINRLHTASDNYFLTLLRYIRGEKAADQLADKVNATYVLLDAQSPALIWKILARKLVFEREEPLLRLAQTYLLYDFRGGNGFSLRTISKQLRIDEDRFRPFNTWLKANTIPDDKLYPVLIRVTTDEFPDVKTRDETRQKTNVAGPGDVGFPTLKKLPPSTEAMLKPAVFYTINEKPGVQAQPCDNPITLAYYGKLAVNSFLAYNDLSDRDVVQPGQIYYLARKAKRAKVPFHVIQKNQTLREVSGIYGVRLKSLLNFNRLRANQRVQTGRIVWLRSKRPKNRPVEYRQLPPETTRPAMEDSLTNVAPVDSAARRLADTTAKAQPDSLVTTTRPGTGTVNTGKLIEVPGPDTTDVITDDKEVATADYADEPAEEEVLKLHKVKAGQTYYGIAQLYGVTLKQLYTWNNLSERIPLEIGQELIVDLTKKRSPSVPRAAARPRLRPKSKVAVPAPVTPAAVAPTVAEPAGQVIYHVVRPGQTLYRVAIINKVTVADLMRWNNLKNYTVEIGQRLVIRKNK